MRIHQLFLLSALLSFLLTPLIVKLCLSLKLFDMPSRRKVHEHPMPRLGGVALILSFIITLFIAIHSLPALQGNFASRAEGLLVSILLLAAVGIVDDIFGLRPLIKLAGQIVAALVLFAYGLRVNLFTNLLTGYEMHLPLLLSAFLTVCWVVGMINAMNLIDGLDGLAAGIAVISGICLICVGFYLNTMLSVVVLIILCGSSLGFLRYNFPPAKIFLGDSGSMFLGLVFAFSGLVGLQYKVATVMALIMPVSVLAIPIYDTFLAIWRRMLHRDSVFIADKKHLHHRILQFGLTQKQVVLIFYAATAYFGVLAFLFILIDNHYALLLLLLLAAGMFMIMRIVGFIERKLKKIHLLEMRLKKHG